MPSRLQSISHATTVVARDCPILVRRLGRELAQTATDLIRALVLEAAIWRSGSNPSLQASLSSLRVGLDGVRWGQELEAIRRLVADPESSLRRSDLEAAATKLSKYRASRVALRMMRGAILGTVRRAVFRRFAGEMREWPELRPNVPGTQLWHLMAKSAVTSGARAYVLEVQSRNISRALRQIASELPESPPPSPADTRRAE